MKSSILLIGNGRLAELAYQHLRESYSITKSEKIQASIYAAYDIALLLTDGWCPSEHRKADEIFTAAGAPLLHGSISFGEAVIGPLVFPGRAGCSQCADFRKIMAGPDRKELFHLQTYATNMNDPWSSSFGLWHAIYLLEDQIRLFFQKGEQQRNQIILIPLNSLTISRHFFLPNPNCRVCSTLPVDTEENAEIQLKKTPKSKPDSYRTRSIDELADTLLEDYFDIRTGLINSKRLDLVSPFADTIANLPLLAGNETTAGRTNSYKESESAAILEALERYCGYDPRGKKMIVHGSYRQFENQAMNPYSIGVHSDEQYSLPGFPFQAFDPDQSRDWVWGFSLSGQKPLLVPRNLAFYSMGGNDGFVYETSNGCALGGSMEEAILYGIFEIVERDAFLMTWYGQLPLQRLEPGTAASTELQLMVQRLKEVAGFDVYLFNSTTENGIPSIWSLAKNTKGKGLNLLCAAGAHLDPVKAAKGAVQELAGMLLSMDEKLDEHKDSYRKMYEDSSFVRHMDDHSLLYGLPEAEHRLAFLLENNKSPISFSQAFKPAIAATNLKDDLLELLERFRQLKMEVIVVDQTSPELKRNSLYCVKVFIPGMIPMTFGHHLTRLKGLDRLLNVPRDLGYVKEPLTFSQLNANPHPFP
ncbi:TOMM precursor leader peptide-binding protein [Bacillus sp. 1P06AnD]|uniref:TOMM precursor leader peptide-binding protein n=1 Tax=Bacillus sp. 1P06AnD TaxID=3132208 RepID=UPI00399F790D